MTPTLLLEISSSSAQYATATTLGAPAYYVLNTKES